MERHPAYLGAVVISVVDGWTRTALGEDPEQKQYSGRHPPLPSLACCFCPRSGPTVIRSALCLVSDHERGEEGKKKGLTGT